MRERKIDRLVYCEESGVKPKGSRNCRPPGCRCLESEVYAEATYPQKSLDDGTESVVIRFFDEEIPGVELKVKGLENGKVALNSLLSFLNKFGHESFTSKVNELVASYDECLDSIKE